jgi:hypothetical protein
MWVDLIHEDYMVKTLVGRLVVVIVWVGVLSGFTGTLCGQTEQTTTPSRPALSLSLSPVADKITAGSPMPVTITMKNISDHEISYWREMTDDPGGFEYKISAWDDKQTAALDSKFGKALRGREDPAFLTADTPLRGTGGWRTLKPGETLTDRVNVGRLFDLSRPGKYTIQVQRLDLDTKSFVMSNKINVVVTQ